jgi:hypothetical protein
VRGEEENDRAYRNTSHVVLVLVPKLNSNTYWVPRQSSASRRGGSSTFQPFRDHRWAHPCTEHIFGYPVSSPKKFEVPRAWEVHARELAPLHRRSVAEFDSSPVLLISPHSKMNEKSTHLEYVVCVSDSRPIQINHFESRPWYVFQETIIVPQRRNWTIHLVCRGHEQRDRLFNAIKIIIWVKLEVELYLTKLVGLIEHRECCAPSDITM